jgi:predicted ATPase
MESYQIWFGGSPELSVLRMLGLFDRPADEKALGALLKPPAIRGLTESLTNLSQIGWRTTIAKLRRAKLLAQEDPHNPGHLDTHPLVREHFGEQLRSQPTDAWKECNRRLYSHYRAIAPQFPDTISDMEPLFLAVICGCHAGLYHEALHEVYIPRIQRGDASFAANVLGARGALLSVLIHFFEQGRWGSPVESGVEGQRLTSEDQLFILMQAGLYLTATRGFASPEMRICYERAEPLCHSLHRPLLLYVTLMGRWRYSLNTDRLTATMRIAERACSLAQEQNEPALMIEAYHISAATLYHLGEFEAAREYATRAVQLWPSGGMQFPIEDVEVPVVTCRCLEALLDWHIGEIAASRATMAEALTLAKALNDMHALAMALWYAGLLSYFDGNPEEVERLASDLIELSTRLNFPYWLAVGAIFGGCACSARSDAAKGVSWIENGIRDYRATGSMLAMPYYLALKAEALHLAGRTCEALEAVNEAEAVAERSDERWCGSELHRLRGVFLMAIGADTALIESSFYAAISIAKHQKSVSLEKRA